MGVGSHWNALGKGTGTHFTGGCVAPGTSLDQCKKMSPSPSFKLITVLPMVSCCTDCTIWPTANTKNALLNQNVYQSIWKSCSGICSFLFRKMKNFPCHFLLTSMEGPYNVNFTLVIKCYFKSSLHWVLRFLKMCIWGFHFPGVWYISR